MFASVILSHSYLQMNDDDEVNEDDPDIIFAVQVRSSTSSMKIVSTSSIKIARAPLFFDCGWALFGNRVAGKRSRAPLSDLGDRHEEG